MFNKSNLAVAGCISKGHYAQSVLFHSGGTVATDGHIAASVTLPDGDIADAPRILGEEPTMNYGEFCVAAENIKTLKKGLSKKTTGSFPILKNAFVIVKGGEKKLAATDLSSEVVVNTHEEGGPPKSAKDLNNLTPNGEPTLEITFDANLLARIVEVFREAQAGDYHNPVTFKFWGPKDVVRLDAARVETGQKIAGLIMPFQK